jgi:hypothetical protein
MPILMLLDTTCTKRINNNFTRDLNNKVPNDVRRIGNGDLWRSWSGHVVARMTSQGHRVAFKVVTKSGAMVLDNEIDIVHDDIKNLLDLWMFQGVDDWPEI